MMASTHASRGSTQKKVVTYGKSSRSRQVNTSDQLLDSRPGISRRTESPKVDGPTSALPDRSAPISTDNRISTNSRVHRVQAGETSSGTGSVSAGSNESDARKRKRSVGFALDEDVPERSTKKNPQTLTTSSPLDQEHRKPISSSKSKPTVLSSRTTQISRSSTSEQGSAHRKSLQSSTKASLTKTSRAALGRSSPQAQHTRKPRLIDRLAAQRPDSSDSEVEPGSSDSDTGRATVSAPDLLGSPSRPPNAPERDVWTRTTTSQTRTPTGKKIRHTYSQVRTMRDDTKTVDDDLGLPGHMQDDMLFADPPGKANAGAFDFPASESEPGEDSDDQKIAIKSVHELRRAGANNRFSDEMEDLLSRIGTPSRHTSSMRRNALLELAHKLQQDDFAAQFRDHATRDNIVKRIGDEDDLISGFAMVATLIIFLSSKTAPHLLRRLLQERVGRLLGRLLNVTDDVDSISSQRTANLSKVGKRSLSGVKSYLLRLPIWFDKEEDDLSPRTAGLQLLSILFRHTDTRQCLEVVKDLGEELKSVVDDQTQLDTEETVDYALVMAILEAQSGVATTLSDSPQISWQASRNAVFLQRTLDKWPEGHKDVESAVLKLAIDTTNTESGAKVFGHQTLLQALVRCICDGVHRVQEAVRNDCLQDHMYDGLLLILGVLINILEQHPPARTTADDRSLDVLITLYLENHESLGDADSESKSKVSVAFGYLAVVLGYLALGQPAREAIQARTNGAGIRSLVGSIREFIGLYRSVDSKVHGLEGLVGELQRQGR